jgi:hypothetical protein
MKDEPLRHTMANPHFVQLVSVISVPWHSISWRKRHPHIDMQAHIDGLMFLLTEGIFAQPEYRQEFRSRFHALLDLLVATDRRLFYSPEDLAWLDEALGTSRALTVMLVMMTTVLSRRIYLTPTQLEKQGLGRAEEWRRKATSIPGAFPTGGDWLFPSSGLRAIGVQTGGFQAEEVVDPDERGPGNADSTTSASQ